MDTLTQLKQVSHSKPFEKALFVLGVFCITGVIFEAGVMVGFRKASFSYASNNHYFETLNGPHHMPLGMNDRDFMGGHGAVGKIIKIDLPSLLIEAPDGSEKSVTLTDKTTIRKFRDTITPNDLLPESFIIVLGAPKDNGTIEARLIRVTPTPTQNLATSSKGEN
jgi:hypothetical protein